MNFKFSRDEDHEAEDSQTSEDEKAVIDSLGTAYRNSEAKIMKLEMNVNLLNAEVVVLKEERVVSLAERVELLKAEVVVLKEEIVMSMAEIVMSMAERVESKAKFDALEMSAMNTSSLVKAFDLIKLFRSYHLTSYNWDAVTNEYKGQKDKLENRLISTYQFDQLKVTFNAKYPMPPETPLLSDIIDLCQERHDEAHTGQIKTIVKQEKFLDDCVVYFETHRISDNTRQVCLPILQKMYALKIAGQLKGL